MHASLWQKDKNFQVTTMLRMLVVDDEPMVSSTVQAGLEDFCGAEVLCYETSSEGDVALQHKRFDAALLDVELPGINGFELAERAANLNVPVLLMPSHPVSIDICLRHGYPHLAKPFLPSILAERVIEAVCAAEENIAQVRAASVKLKGTASSLAEAITTAKHTVIETTALMARLTAHW